MKIIPGKEILEAINKDSIKLGFHQTLAHLEDVADAYYPIIMTLLHENPLAIRCQVVLNAQGDDVLLDISPRIFDLLPEKEASHEN